MINLAFPDFSFLDILKSCQDNDKRLYQNEIIIPRVNKKILEFGRLYDRCAQTNNLHSCDLTHFYLNEDINYLEKLYSYRLQKTKEGRVYYDKIINDISDYCPYCNHGEVSQVDHFLPQSLYDSFTIYPNNLVPICAVCNTTKDDYYGKDYSSNLLHPYFDNLNNSQWLFAHLIENSRRKLIVEYTCNPDPNIFNDIDIARIINHFNTLKLNKRFKDISRSQSRQIKSNLTRIIHMNNKSAKRAYIKREINKNIRIHGFNHWNVALYQAFYAYEGNLADFV